MYIIASLILIISLLKLYIVSDLYKYEDLCIHNQLIDPKVPIMIIGFDGLINLIAGIFIFFVL